VKHLLAALGGIVCGFLLGELVAVAAGITAEAVLDVPMPFVLKLMPLYLAVAGAVAGPYLVHRGAHRNGRRLGGHR